MLKNNTSLRGFFHVFIGLIKLFRPSVHSRNDKIMLLRNKRRAVFWVLTRCMHTDIPTRGHGQSPKYMIASFKKQSNKKSKELFHGKFGWRRG